MDRAPFLSDRPESSPTSNPTGRATPFLKWAGGKRWFVQSYASLLPAKFNRYIEPFLGSGAVFFYLAPNCGVVADKNAELVEAYQAVRDNWEQVSTLLEQHGRKHSKRYYYKIRDGYAPRGDAQRAARFIYLNRTCWNGLYRVNRNGDFNVPVGTKSNVVLPSDNFGLIAGILKSVEIRVAEFSDTISLAQDGDFVFVDPPYVTKRHNGSFIKYNEKLFAWDDQLALRQCLIEASSRGVKILATNANNRLLRRLYENDFEVTTLSRGSVISGDAAARGRCAELIIRNY